jgi:hypothetical protein
MKFWRVLAVVAVIAMGASVAKADEDPTFKINKGGDAVPVSDLSDFSVSIPDQQFSFSFQYTGEATISELELLFVPVPGQSISIQSDIFASVSETVENGDLLFILTGSGPCMANGVNIPPADCVGFIGTGDIFTLSGPGFAPGTPTQTLTFVPEPGAILLSITGLVMMLGVGIVRKRVHGQV